MLNLPSGQTLDRSAHPWNTNDEFIVPIDTGDTAIWLYAKDFLRIEKYGKDPTDWPRSNIDHTKPMVVALTMPDRDGQHTLRPYIMTRNPFVKNNDCKDELEGVEYVDNTAVYTRCFRDLKLTTNFPTWNWMTQTIEHNFTVALPCTLAYAANDSMVQTKYDGNLGLGVPKVSSLFLNSRSSSQRRPFMEWYDAISDRRVHSSREFYLRLISPQVFKECQNAHSFICFSSQFPCNHVPEFTAPLQLSMSQHALTSSISRHWNVSLMGMSLQQYRLDRNGKKKDVGLPIPLTELEKLAHDHELAVQHHEHILRREPQQRRTNLKIRGLIVTLDSASTNSRLPWQVVDELAVKWLQNSPFPSGTSIHTNPYYDQGAENSRDLKRCDIIFTFYDEGTSQEYAFRCPSEPFLSSMWPAYAQPQEGMHSAPFSTQAKSSLLWGVRGRCILGMNFHWAAIVHYVGPKLQNGHHLQPPYVRFAPQRVVKYDQTAGKYTTLTEKDLVLDPRWVHRCST